MAPQLVQFRHAICQVGCRQTFLQCFDHFVKFVKLSKEDQVLLVLDGHNSHARNIPFLEKGRGNHPLDVGFMFPLKTLYAQEIEDWLHQNPNKVVTNFTVGKIFNVAYNRAVTMEITVNSFKKTGFFHLTKRLS
ncbi:hypothetical protein PR048_018755 [Dryococelus australis]|uniref:DDE-1 domain-containing protein n=1 Tax=Dryococelus australis TaxID=614101 RepID=A0ABQ9HD66_9NEOP|nr:hypothetical protein PR048_018755 [Dryococelus australis]